MIVTLLLHAYFIAAIAPVFYSMAAFRVLFADIDHWHYACRSDSLGIITCQRKRSVSSILCSARFSAGVLQTEVLSFVLVQDRYKSVLSSCVLLIAIVTVSSRQSCNWPKLF
jgi:hypothetical protein